MPAQIWTKAQNDAITAKGGSVLVSAAAGSGKTAVLVERAISIICDERNPVDADKLLIVTFSNAAAAEMKQRMSARLSRMIREKPADLFLQRQQTLLASAQISTIHSFCLELIRLNFQNLDVSPDFSVADEHELAVMKSDCADACIESFYSHDDNGELAELVELLSTGRDDSRLVETILKIYDFSRAHPFFEDWLDEKLKMYDTELPVGETVWGKSILRYAISSLKFCHASTLKALEVTGCDEKMEKAYGTAFREDLRQICECVDAADASDWDTLFERLSAFTFERLGPLRGNDYEKRRIQEARARNKDILQALAKKYLNASGDDFRADLVDLRPKIAVLFQLVKEFAVSFSAAKSEKRRLDFSDFEHLALKLLVRKTPDGYVRTDAAIEIAARFEHVLVDEYQDTNEVQDLIFTSISREQKNLFMVGDVKQSIYAFRQAMPEIFIAKRQKFFPYESGLYPAKINLDTNFRSRSEVTNAINFLFKLLMSDELGNVDYDDAESLKCGAKYEGSNGAKPALMLVSAGEYAGSRDMTALEAHEIAMQIRSMLESGFAVQGADGMRRAVPSDFCVLLRAPRNRADIYVRELSSCGVSAWAESSGGYLSAREVSSAVCMLKAVDNPLLDIELVAALMSPFFDFDDDDIAKIRLKARGVPFYTALCLDAEENEKSANFMRVFRTLRAQAAILSADRLIMLFYEMTGAMSIVRAMPMGENRATNLQLLIEYAAEYHAFGYKRLEGFIGFLSRLEEKNRDLTPANTVGDGANVVRVMSIHHSKGLEFPVVFLADCSKSFNKMDLRAAAILHSKYGFACVRRDNKLFKQFSTVPMQAIRLESEREALSEEMRLLYVALTRAREKLIVSVVCKTNLQKKLSGLCCELENGKLNKYATGGAGSYGDWVLMALLHHRSAAALRECAGVDGLELVDDGNEWDILLREPDSEDREADAEKTEFTAQPDTSLLEELKRRVAYQYPFEAETKIPAKMAVSEAAKGTRSLQYRFAARPNFMGEYALTAAEKGNATHKFMQFADYENARDNLAGEISRMKRDRFLSAAEADSLSKSKLRSFFQSALAKRIFKSGDVRRELKFMAECGAEVLGDKYGSDAIDAKIVLQGVADCVFIENDGAVIVDYKTDHVASLEELKERYQAQLRLYSAILEERLGVPVKERILYSFAFSAEVQV